MFDTINTAGALYLAGKALVRKTTQESSTHRKLRATREGAVA